MKPLLLAGCAFFISTFLNAQTDSVLFSIDDVPVAKSEFQYIYEKNNPENADYSRKSVEEYLDLYVNFKLKVAKARDVKLDTIKALAKELKGYRNQLAKSYMVDKDVTSNLVEEAFERKKKDLEVSHILVSVSKRPSKEELDKAKAKAAQIKTRIRSQEEFVQLARTMSDDRSSAQQDGKLGWMTAILPDGFYQFENAIYSQKKGEISNPIESKLGYHLIMVTDERPARGEMEVAHILVRARMKGQEVAGAQAKADSIHQLLQKGQSFETLAEQYSDDKNTSTKGGHLGFFGITQFDKAFEDAAFALTKDDSYTRPVRTAIGWHIIKRKSKKDYTSLAKVRRVLEDKLKQNDRYDLAKASRLNQIRSEGNFSENLSALNKVKAGLTKNFYTYKWETPKVTNAELFSFDKTNQGLSFSVQEFMDYTKKAVRTRLRMDKTIPLADALMELYNDFKDEKTIQYEEDNLEKKYPDFKSLMKEYEEGILVFEAINKYVWQKASADTTALRTFYNKHQKEYYWKPRGRLHRYTINETSNKKIKAFKKDLIKLSPDRLKDKYNRDETILEHKMGLYEVGGEEFLGLRWEPKSIFAEANEKQGVTTIKYLEDILPETQKKFKECRGYVIADYQTEIETKWVKSLAKEFKVDVNQDVLQSMIK